MTTLVIQFLKPDLLNAPNISITGANETTADFFEAIVAAGACIVRKLYRLRLAANP